MACPQGRPSRPGSRQRVHRSINVIFTKRLFGSILIRVTALLPLDSTKPDSRRHDILHHATQLFGSRGYGQTSIRDIAAAVGMLPGSVYYHFASKEALLAAVYTEGIERSIATVEAAIAAKTNPWDRLEAAAVAHLSLLLADGALAAIIGDGRNQPIAARDALIQQRNRYEAVFRRLVADVDLPPCVQPGPFRLALLGALNWALTWYRPDGDPPEVVARDLFAIFRTNQPTHPFGSREIQP
jgi:AcrR family transcriptional regulator